MPDIIHLFPVDDDSPIDHTVDDLDCFCCPKVLQICPFCLRVGCQFCHGTGLVVFYSDERDILVLHNKGN